MATQYETEPLPNGTVVRILNSGYGPSTIAEYRGPLGPNGVRIYRVHYRKKPHTAYTEVREDQLEIVTPAQ